MPATKEEVVRLRVTPALKKQLEELAGEWGESMSVIVREALREFLEKRDKQQLGGQSPRATEPETEYQAEKSGGENVG